MLVQHALDKAALHPSAAAVDQPDFAQPGLVRRPYVLIND
jgi:hypothetical protein